MDVTRAQEIIAAYGADAGRWPADERAAAEALIARDAGLRAALEAATALDSDIAAWAMAPVDVVADDIAASAAADAALARLPAPRRWFPAAMLGGSIAASLLAAVLILPSGSDPAPEPQQLTAATPATPPVQTAQAEPDLQLWGTVFTLTPEEESLI